MVLHNDKWKAKARRTNEIKHGVKHVRNSTLRHEARSAQDGPGKTASAQASNRSTQTDRPAQTNRQERDAQGLDRSRDQSSDDYDESDDEGKTADEIAASEARRAASRKLRESEAGDASQPRQDNLAEQTRSAANNVAAAAASRPQAEEDDDELDDDRGKYSRRRMQDNAWRYEEAPLDPYIVQEEQEAEEDFSRLRGREWQDPNEEELVPEVNARKAPQAMQDTTAFEDFRLRQQKEEIARDLRTRFGGRRPVNRASDVTNDHDDEFFSSTAQSRGATSTASAPARPIRSQRDATGEKDIQQLESFLDDLLRV